MSSHSNIKNFLNENGFNETKNDINDIFFNCIFKNEINKLKIVIKYAIKNDITLEINEKNKNGDYPILLSVDRDNNEMTKLLMDYANKNSITLEINESNEKGECPLLISINNDNIEMTKLLMEYAIRNNIILDINKKDDDGVYLLLQSLNKNNHKMTKLLIDYANENNITLEINESNKNGECPLLMSVNNNNIEMTKLLIDYANKNNITLEINKKNIKGESPLLISINNNDAEMTKLLIDYAHKHNIIIDVGEKDEGLFKSAESSVKRIDDVLIPSRFKVNSFKSISSKPESNITNEYTLINSNLDISIMKDVKKDVVVEERHILETHEEKNGFSIGGFGPKLPDVGVLLSKIEKSIETGNMKSISTSTLTAIAARYNDTSLTFNCKLGYIDVVKKLIKCGFDINEYNKEGDTPLTIACKLNNTELVEYLLDNGCDVNKPSEYGFSPLLIACYLNDNVKIINCLIEYGANINESDYYGNTPLLIAKRLKYREIENVLINNNANGSIPDMEGTTYNKIINEEKKKNKENELFDIQYKLLIDQDRNFQNKIETFNNEYLDIHNNFFMNKHRNIMETLYNEIIDKEKKKE